MRSSDLSSDVCSSDLGCVLTHPAAIHCFRFHAPISFNLVPGSASLSRFGFAGVLRPTHGVHLAGRRFPMVLDGLGHAVVVGAMTSAVIELDQVSLGWRDRVAVRDVSGAFARGSLTAIVGPNGAGKSTLIKGIMGLLSPLRGHIRLAGDARDQMACLPQQGELDRSFPISTYDLVAMGAWRRTGPWKRFGAAEHDRVQSALRSEEHTSELQS